MARGLVKFREHLDNKDIHARALDMVLGMEKLRRDYIEEWEVLVICGVFGVTFRDAEEMFELDHVTLHEWYNSAIAHLTDFLNGEE